MPRYPGVGPRIRERLLALGFVRKDGAPDVTRFCLDYRYDKTIFYEWIGDRSTPTKDLDRLADDLKVARSWLLLGDGPPPRRGKKPVPIAGGSGADATQALDFTETFSLLSDLVRRWLHTLWYPPRPWAPVAVGA